MAGLLEIGGNISLITRQRRMRRHVSRNQHEKPSAATSRSSFAASRETGESCTITRPATHQTDVSGPGRAQPRNFQSKNRTRRFGSSGHAGRHLLESAPLFACRLSTGFPECETFLPVMQRFSWSNISLIVYLTLPLLAGCAEGPLWRTGNFAPWVRQKWAKEEKQYGATLRTKLNDVDALASRAWSMRADDRDKWSAQLAHLAASDPSPLLRARIVEVLPLFPSPQADAALRNAIRDRDSGVRIAACKALGQRGGADGLQALSHAMSDDNLDVRLAAIRALGELDEPATSGEAIRSLGVALDDKDPAIQYRAIESLRNVSGRDYGNNLVAWREFVQGGQPVETPPSIVEQIRSWF
jgi:hypothetical protein